MWPQVVLMGVIWIAVMVGVAWVQVSDFMRGLTVGAMGMVIPFLLYTYLAAGRTVHWGMGADAEQWTTEALRKLGRSWLVVDDISFVDGNVDHVVIGPSVVYAVESKYMNSADDRRLASAGRQAQANARRIQSLLRSGGVDRAVEPVVVVWGRGRRRLGGPHQVREGVRFLSGRDRNQWLDMLRSSSENRGTDTDAYDVVVEFVKRREEFESRKARGGLRRFLLSG